jgi:putative lipoprotein
MTRSTIAAALSVAAMAGCPQSDPVQTAGEASTSSSGAGSAAELHVEVAYRERMMLPPTATVEVVLEDSAKMDVAADLIASESVPAKSGPPYRITLHYDPSKLSPRGRFGIRARIEDQGKLMFTSTDFIPAFGKQGSYDEPPNDPVRVLVRRASGSATSSATSITNTRWVLQELRGEPAGLGAGGRAPEITLQGAESRVSGFAGCNQITGGYVLDGDKLSFGQMAITMRACEEGEALEREFAKVLGETRSYEIAGSTLRLRDEAGAVVAELEAD